MIETFGASDVGCVRELNEDCFCVNVYDAEKNKGFFILADGMGGHNAGEVASQNAVKYIAERLKNLQDIQPEEIPDKLTEVVCGANEYVYEMSVSSSEQSGMGTTVVVAFVCDKKVYIANVGDSRAYHINGDGINQITIDHSVVAELVMSGTITADEARKHPQRNIITRAVGTENTVKIDLFETEYKKGDMILMCSDGLCSMIEDKEICDIAKNGENAENAVCKLIDVAKISGGLDNITVICIRFI